MAAAKCSCLRSLSVTERSCSGSGSMHGEEEGAEMGSREGEGAAEAISDCASIRQD
jgi:hypothetical protein